MAQSIFDPKRTLEQRRQAVANLFDFLVKGGLADTRRTPSQVIDDGPKRTLHRYEPVAGVKKRGSPVLLVPPLGAQATCFDLRRGCSLAEHLVTAGRPTYLVDYGPIKYSDKELGLEYWITEVLPGAVRTVSQDGHIVQGGHAGENPPSDRCPPGVQGNSRAAVRRRAQLGPRRRWPPPRRAA